MKRRDFIKLAGLSALSMSFSQVSSSQQQARRKPNIVLIVSDDHGLELGCYGNNVIKTPNIDVLAGDGTIFTNAYCTTASCSPSRSVILTGLHNHATGQYGLANEPNNFASFEHIKSLPSFLKEAQYRTARVGKYHVAPESVYKFENVFNTNMRNPVQMAKVCKRFISSDEKRPFFLYFCPVDPHRSFEHRENKRKANRFGNMPFKDVKTIKYEPDEVIVPSYLPDTQECREELAEYYQAISRLDTGIGKLIEILKKAGKYDNTLIIYISDNGPPFVGAKATAYEPGLHLPCIVKKPYQKKTGTKCNAMITWADITPTILDFAGVAVNKDLFHGRSFRTIIETENPDGWDEIYASHTFHGIKYYYPMRVVRYRQYKLIRNIEYSLQHCLCGFLMNTSTWYSFIQSGKKYYGKRTLKRLVNRPEFELYDIEKDPDEIYNLADDPQYHAVFEELKNKIKVFQKKTKDPWIQQWDYEKLLKK